MAGKLLISPSGSGLAAYLSNNTLFISAPFWGFVVQMPPPPGTNLVDFAIGLNDQIYGVGSDGFVYFLGLFSVGWIREWGNGSHVISISFDPKSTSGLFCIANDGSGDKVWHIDYGSYPYQWQPYSLSFAPGGSLPPLPSPTWEYTVKDGDHIYQIIRNEYPVVHSVPGKLGEIFQQILGLNPGIANHPNLIHKGDVLKMPPK